MKRACQTALFVVAVLLGPIVATVFYLLVRDTLPSQVPDVLQSWGFFTGNFPLEPHSIVDSPVIPSILILTVGLIVLFCRGLTDADRSWIPILVICGSQMAWGWTLSLAVSIGAPSGTSVHPHFWQLEAMYFVMGLQIVLIYRIAPWKRRDVGPAPASPLVLGPRERVYWVGRSVNRAKLWRAGVIATGSVVAAVWSVPAALALLILAALEVVKSAATARVNDREVRISWNPLGLPARRIALERISCARVVEQDRAQFDDESWSKELGQPGPSSAVFGKAPVLVLEGPDILAIALSLPDAAEAADLVNALIARQRAAAGTSAALGTSSPQTARSLEASS